MKFRLFPILVAFIVIDHVPLLFAFSTFRAQRKAPGLNRVLRNTGFNNQDGSAKTKQERFIHPQVGLT